MGWLTKEFLENFSSDFPQTKIPRHKNYDGNRLHVTPYGLLPGVTTILGATKDRNSLYFLKKWQKQNPKERDRVLNRGRGLDNYVQTYFLGKQPEPHYLYDQIWDFLKTLRPLVIEYPLASVRGYAGSPDAICLNENNETVLIDWKTSTRKKQESWVKDYKLQLIGYREMIKENFGFYPQKHIIAIATEEIGKADYFQVNPTDLLVDEFYDRLKQYQQEYCEDF
jgi:hypothetical protein